MKWFFVGRIVLVWGGVFGIRYVMGVYFVGVRMWLGEYCLRNGLRMMELERRIR